MGHDVRIKVVFDYECPLLEPRILTNPHMIQTGHIWFFQLAVCFWVLGLPLFPFLWSSLRSFLFNKKCTGFRPRKAAEASRKDVLRGRLRKGMLVRGTMRDQQIEYEFDYPDVA